MASNFGQAIQVLRRGGVVVFPSDTVWGVGALVSSKEGVEKFYRVKGREQSKPSQVLVADVDMANRYGVMDKRAWGLAAEHWPGGLTMVVKAKGNRVPAVVRGGSVTVGLRVPDKAGIQELLQQLGEGLVASSANVSGGKPPMKREEIDLDLMKSVDLVMEGKAGGRPSSTVVDVSEGEVRVLRQGEIKLNF